MPRDESQWPDAWKTTYYKTYPRAKKILLPQTKHSADFFSLVRARHTNRDFNKNVVTPEIISALLRYSCGVTYESAEWNPRRAQPSGGARFPLEVYPIFFCDAGSIPAGVYHYNVKEHALDTLKVQTFSDNDIAQIATYPFVRKASMMIVLTAVFWRTQVKYGERGYRYILLEAGHVGQNAYLASMALGVKCSGLGGTIDTAVEKLLDIDGVNESVVYGLVIG